MNILQKILYVFACNTPAFMIWGAYSLVYHNEFSLIALICTLASAFISSKQLTSMRDKLERIPVVIDEMPIRGIDATSILSTVVSYVFLFSPLLPDEIKGIKPDTMIIVASLMLQAFFAIISDSIPYDLFYIMRGYAYRPVKIDGTEHILLCKKRITDRHTIKAVINPFHGFLIHVK